jgi:hypothetical protein
MEQTEGADDSLTQFNQREDESIVVVVEKNWFEMRTMVMMMTGGGKTNGFGWGKRKAN